MCEFWGNLAIGVVVASASAWITVHLSLRKFRSERWWERKASGYAEALDALHSLKRGLQQEMTFMDEGHRLDFHPSDEYFEGRHSGPMSNVHKVADTSVLLLCKEAGTALHQLLGAIQGAESMGGRYWTERTLCDAIGGVIEAVDGCISSLADAARKDLGVE